MEDVTQKAKRDIPYLVKWINDLLNLANKVMVKDIKYDQDDNFAFMILCFFSKQVTHIKSILALKYSRDVALITRSMIEGLCQLLWAADSPDDRAFRWRTFACVHDWRVMRRQNEAGKPLDMKVCMKIEKLLSEYGDQFLIRSARAAISKGKLLQDDPYYSNWTGSSIREICKCVGLDDLYLEIYKPFSDWHHWSPGGLGAAMKHYENRVIYLPMSHSDLATSLAVGFQCLIKTLEIINNHLKLNMTSMIADLKERYIAWGRKTE